LHVLHLPRKHVLHIAEKHVMHLPGKHALLYILEEGGVELVERVDVREEEGDCLLRHVLLFGNLVPEPLGSKNTN